MEFDFMSHQQFLHLFWTVFLVFCFCFFYFLFLWCSMLKWRDNLKQAVRCTGAGGLVGARCVSIWQLFVSLLFTKGVMREKLCLVICGSREEEKGWEGQVLWQMVPHELSGTGFLKIGPLFPDFYLRIARILALASSRQFLEKSPSGDSLMLPYCPYWCAFPWQEVLLHFSQESMKLCVLFCFVFPDVNHHNKFSASNWEPR